MKHRKDLEHWFTKVSREYKEAIDGKRIMQGVDSSEVMASMQYFERLTSQKITQSSIRSLLHYGTQNLRAALKLAKFKSNRIKLWNWVGYVRSLAKKNILTLKNMYKSEETLRKEREKEEQVFREANVFSDAQA